MEGKQQTITEIHRLMRDFGDNMQLSVEVLDKYTKTYIDRISQLESELQMAIDEVNRLNVLLAGSCGNFADRLG